MSTNLVSYSDYITPLVCAQRHIDNVYFDLTSTFDCVSHSLLLPKLSAYGLSDDYVSWLCSYITNQFSFADILVLVLFVFMVLIRHYLRCFLVYLKDLSWGLCCSTFSLTTFVILLNVLDTFCLLII